MTDTRDTIGDGVRDTVRDASNAVTTTSRNSTTIATIVAVVAVALLALYAFGVFGSPATTPAGVTAPTMTMP